MEITIPSAGNTKFWNPARFTRVGEKVEGCQTTSCSVITLNQPLEELKETLVRLCTDDVGTVLICADGGANRLYQLNLSGHEEASAFPLAICGDMDSLLPEVKTHYENMGTKIHIDQDQNSTDLDKCLKYLTLQASPHSDIRPGVNIAVFGGLGGRADQALSLLHQLYKFAEDESRILGDFYLITPDSILFVLEKGRNIIPTPVGPGRFNEYIGIVPLGRSSVVTSKGLRYEMTDLKLEIGVLVSTSNSIVSPVVEVQTTERVICSIGHSSKKDQAC